MKSESIKGKGLEIDAYVHVYHVDTIRRDSMDEGEQERPKHISNGRKKAL